MRTKDRNTQRRKAWQIMQLLGTYIGRGDTIYSSFVTFELQCEDLNI